MNWESCWRVKLLSLIPLVAMAVGSAGAVQKVDDTTSDTVTASTTTAKGRASLTLKNDAAGEVAVAVGSEFHHETTQAAVKAQWVKYPLGAGPGGEFTLKANEIATFEVSGEFVDPGVYETFIEVVESTGGRLRYPVRITRTIQAIQAEFLLEPKPVRIGLSFPDITTSSPYLIRLSGRNASSEPIEVAAPLVGQILVGSADARSQAATSKAPGVADNGCAGQVLAGQSCVFDIQLPQGLSPGSYSLDVLMPGRGGGQSARTITIDIRASAWLAGIVIALGVALGAAVTDWRATGRPVAALRIEAARLREETGRLASSTGQVPVARRASQLVLELKALDAEILDGKDGSAKLTEYRERFGLLTRSDALLQAAAQPKGEAADTFSLLAQRLAAALGTVEWKGETVIAAADKLGAELSGFQSLFEAARRYDERTIELAPAIAYLGTAGESADWKGARDLRQGAFRSIEADGDNIETVARAKALNEATDKLTETPATVTPTVLSKVAGEIADALKAQPSARRKTALERLQQQVTQLKAVQPPTSGTLIDAVRLSQDFQGLSGLESAPGDVPAILDPDSGLKFTWPNAAFQPAAGASLAELGQSLRLWDWITNLIVLAGIASVGVLVLWATNTTWGSVQDILLALLAGAGTRLSIGKIGQTQNQ